MKIAFYAPLKSPNDPTPSGDRQIARNLIDALELTRHDVVLASELRTFEGAGSIDRQHAIKAEALNQANQLLEEYRSGRQERPDAWLTYHIYHKAPDWIGPAVCAALEIPYIIVEASISPRQDGGKWDTGHRAACASVVSADLILGLNPRDAECVQPQMKSDARYQTLPPFIDTRPFATARSERIKHRKALSEPHNIDQSRVWLLAVGMMRKGDKSRSYELLADALDLMADQNWHLISVGDGPDRPNVEGAFARHADRVTRMGEKWSDELPSIYAACDVLAWPAINEALGMVFLEAGAAGVASVAGHTDGVASIVMDGQTGLIAPSGDVAEFAAHLRTLINDENNRETLGRNARHHVQSNHSLETVAMELDRHIRSVGCEVAT